MQITPLMNATANLSSFAPTASNTGIGLFQDGLKTVLNAMMGKRDDIGGVPTSPGNTNFEELLEKQKQLFERHQSMSIMANLAQSEHQGKMAAINAMRVT